jgi:hypothetical protein
MIRISRYLRSRGRLQGRFVGLIRCSAVILGALFVSFGSVFRAHAVAEAEMRANRFNWVLGTQTFGPKYQFTDQHPLLETANVIEEMGASVVKFALGPVSKKDPPLPPEINSLVTLAKDHPPHRAVLDKDFAFYVLWLDAFAHRDWHKGFSSAARDAEYREVYDLVSHLLKTYSGSEKTFYLGHWEGDGMLRHTVSREDDSRVTPAAVQGMIDWLNTRQQAVDDAKRDTPHSGVNAWHYTEVNHVVLARDENRPALVNLVLPSVAVDFVSYSAYDGANKADPQNLKSALDYIESKLQKKPGISGRRVFIGEYGFPLIKGAGKTRTPIEQDMMSRVIMRAGLEWGCPFVLYWELYNNEVSPDGSQIGFWMIDDKGEKQPVYRTHQTFFEWGKSFFADWVKREGRAPADGEFRSAAVNFLGP